MTYEEYKQALPSTVTFFVMQPMYYHTMNQYPELDPRVWVLLSWFERFRATNEMQYITIEDKRFYLVRSNAVMASLWIHGIRERHLVGKLLNSLCGINGIEGKVYFLEKYTLRDRGDTSTYYAPTQALYDLFNTVKGINVVNNVPEAPVEETGTYEVSPELLEFQEKLYARQSERKFPHKLCVKGEVPQKLWIKAELYVHSLLKGAFIQEFCSTIKGLPDVLPPMSMDEIVDTCIMAPIMGNGGLSIDKVFLSLHGKTDNSPFITYLVSKGVVSRVKPLDPEKLEAVKAESPYLFSKSSEDVPKSGFASCLPYVGKVDGLVKDDPRIYKLHDMVLTWTGDRSEWVETIARMNKRNPDHPINVLDMYSITRYMMQYLAENHAIRDKKYFIPLDRFLSDITVGKSDNRRWVKFLVFYYELHKKYLTESSAIKTKVQEVIKVKAERRITKQDNDDCY